MQPKIGMRVRLNVPDDRDYEGAKNGDVGIITEVGYDYYPGNSWWVRWDRYPDSHFYHYPMRTLQYLREKG